MWLQWTRFNDVRSTDSGTGVISTEWIRLGPRLNLYRVQCKRSKLKVTCGSRLQKRNALQKSLLHLLFPTTSCHHDIGQLLATLVSEWEILIYRLIDAMQCTLNDSSVLSIFFLLAMLGALVPLGWRLSSLLNRWAIFYFLFLFPPVSIAA